MLALDQYAQILRVHLHQRLQQSVAVLNHLLYGVSWKAVMIVRHPMQEIYDVKYLVHETDQVLASPIIVRLELIRVRWRPIQRKYAASEQLPQTRFKLTNVFETFKYGVGVRDLDPAHDVFSIKSLSIRSKENRNLKLART